MCRVGIAIWSANYPGNLAPVRAGVVSILGTPNRGTGARWALVDILRIGNGAPVTALSWSPCGRYPLLWSFAFHLLLFFPLLFLILEMQYYELDRRLCYIWLGCFSFMLEALNVLSDFIMGELKNVLHIGMFHIITKSGSRGDFYICVLDSIHKRYIFTSSLVWRPWYRDLFFILSLTTYKLDKEERYFHKHDITLTLLHDASIRFKTWCIIHHLGCSSR